MAGRKNTLLAHLDLFMENTKLSFLSAMEYRFNFIMQAFGMMVNNSFWLVFWWLLFERFETINGWAFKEMILLYSVVTVSFGIANFFFNNARRMDKVITEGRLDYYLTLPKNVFFHSIQKSSFSAFGDLLFGLVLIPFAISLNQIPLYAFFVILSTILFISVSVTLSSIAFYFGNAERAGRTGDEAFLTFASYPLSAFGGLTKFFLLTIFPAGFISGIPVEVLNEFSLKWMGYSALVTSIFLVISLIVFYVGLKMYESGNLLYAKD